MNEVNTGNLPNLAEIFSGNASNTYTETFSSGNAANGNDADFTKLLQLLTQLLGQASASLKDDKPEIEDAPALGNLANLFEAPKAKTDKADKKDKADKSDTDVKAEKADKADKTEKADSKDKATAGGDTIQAMRELLNNDSLTEQQMLEQLLTLLMAMLQGADADNTTGNTPNPGAVAGNKPNKKEEAAKTGNMANKKEDPKGNEADKADASLKGKGKAKGKADDKPDAGGKYKVDARAVDRLADSLGAITNRVEDPAAAAKLATIGAELRQGAVDGTLSQAKLEKLEERIVDLADDMPKSDLGRQLKYLAPRVGDLESTSVDATSAKDEKVETPKEAEAFFKELAMALTEIAEVAPSPQLREAIEEAVEQLEEKLEDGAKPDAKLLDDMIKTVSGVKSDEAGMVVKLLQDSKDAF